MGNENSKQVPDGATAADDASMRSVVRKPLHARLPRKSSMNIFKRMDSKNPLSPSTTATVIVVPPPDDMALDGAPRDVPIPCIHARRHSTKSPIDQPEAQPRPSTATMTERLAQQPLSASNTITNLPETSRNTPSHPSSSNDADNEASSDKIDSQPPVVPLHRSSALSPTLPSPSPLPEDSPHKYGLRDRMDTPEMPEPVQSAPDISIAKARRRSSGLEIFNDAKQLQSASSFLNGLSTARRRAESRSNSHSNFTTRAASATDFTRPASATFYNPPNNTSQTSLLRARRHSTSQTHHTIYPPSSQSYSPPTTRHTGHNFKPSGFAYAHSLTPQQNNCYTSHSNLRLSANKHAPVECAVCHMDDDREHWSCSWCALRMCGYCRRGFATGGLGGLRARVRGAELGGGVEGTIWGEGLGMGMGNAGRGRRASFV
ncbi:hypothetical protein MBLNU230_g2461t1 [Neophaeotheca triangularis]